jgi:peptide/nickel transport system ATP-binding protein
MNHKAAWERSLELLKMVRLPDPPRVAVSYPHQLSGGMQQRVLIAMALSTSPRLLVLDEPTTSLDVTTQASILRLLQDLIEGGQTAVLYVTHNLGVVAQICHRVAVLYAGELVEDAPLVDLFNQPLHPYTQGLLDSVPKLGQNKNQAPLASIQGQIPTLSARPSGCVFAPRCPLAIEICQERPPLFKVSSERSSRCHRWQEIADGQISSHAIPKEAQLVTIHSPDQVPGEPALAIPAAESVPSLESYPILSIKDLAVHFDVRRSIGEILTGKQPASVKAVDDVSLIIPAGKTLGLVGESGSGKTSLARAIVGLVERAGGDINLLGLSLHPKLSHRTKEMLRHIQMVFQNPEEALNPYLTVGASLRRPLMVLLKQNAQAADVEAKRLLAAVRLPPEYTERMPFQLSGGEKQRVAIARAFATQPDLLIADEPVSSLDVSVQASILNLLNQLQTAQGSALLFISHDLAVVGYLADQIAVIYLGHLMEMAPASEIFEPPYNPYTEALLSAIPQVDPSVHHEQILLEGDTPSPSEVLSGCPFYSRCPRVLGEICAQQPPPLSSDPETGKMSYCHIPLDELRILQQRVFSS